MLGRLIKSPVLWFLAILIFLANLLFEPIEDFYKTLNPPTAVIVDQLQLSYPNPDFVRDTIDLLQNSGYEVDYVAGEDVTVHYYQSLGRKDYDLMIFRVHQPVITQLGDDDITEFGITGMFTGQKYDPYYYPESMSGVLGKGNLYNVEDTYPVFGVSPDLFNFWMEGDFNDSLVILMGCAGTHSTALPRAFLYNGAEAVIGWDQDVSANHTDLATSYLLDQILVHEMSLEDAVGETMDEVGPDIYYGSKMEVVFN